MFKSREKIGFKIFIKQHYLPLITDLVDNMVDVVYPLIGTNQPPIVMSKEQVKFELTVLFLRTSGYGLTQIKGLDERLYGQLALIVDEYLKTNFAHIKLDPSLLDGKEHMSVFSDQYIYYGNKVKAYKKYELAYHGDKISKQDFPFAISAVFFAHVCEYKMIIEPLALSIGELHKMSTMNLYQRLSALSKKYQIIPDI